MIENTIAFEETPDILIVDDTPANLELLAGMLRDRGYEPRLVPSGKLALAAIQADPPDLVLLDIRMPEMSGFEVCQRLKANPATTHIPIIFITALTETEDKVKAFSLGAVDYVTKPFQAEEIEARVRAHLRIGWLQRQLQKENDFLERKVAERTAELARANERLLDFGRLKDDFLTMISHELCTPVNGVLGIGELILDLCPPSEEAQNYSSLFYESNQRLRNLIEDVRLIADLENMARKDGPGIPFSRLLAGLGTACPEIKVAIDRLDGLEAVCLQGDPRFLARALENIILLAAAFSRDRHSVRIAARLDPQFLKLEIGLDAFHLSAAEAASFFAIESLARSASAAETLGLAPVAAQRILAALGGEVSLVKEAGSSGRLKICFLRAQIPG